MHDEDSIIRTAQVAAGPRELAPGTIYAVLSSDGGVALIDTDQWEAIPRRVHRTTTVSDPESFLAYLNQRGAYELGGLEVWADQRSLSVVGIIDGGRGWRCDRVELKLTPSPEWEKWTARSGKLESQTNFADFVEDSLSNIAEPDGATLLEIIQSMQGTTKVTWQSAEWINNGARAFQYVEDIEATAGRKGRLEVPARFTLGLRPFVGAAPYRVTVNLRYRIDKGTLLVGFTLPDLSQVVEQSFAEVAEKITQGVTVPVLYGRPGD